MEQAKTSFPTANSPKIETFWEVGDTVYREVFEEECRPEAVMKPYIEALNSMQIFEELIRVDD